MWGAQRERPGALNSSTVPEEHVDGADAHREQHQGEAHLEVAGEGDGEAVAVADAGEHHVGRGADEGAVAAQTGAQGDGPPEGRHVHAAALHGEDQGDEGGYEGDVVQEGGDDGRDPQDQQV